MLLWRQRQCPFAIGSVLMVITSAYIAGTEWLLKWHCAHASCIELARGSEGEAGVEPGMKVMRAGRIKKWNKLVERRGG
jgi:hypothetical protein